MIYCFYCELSEVEEENRACDRCTKILKNPEWGIRLMRGALLAKLRHQFSSEECSAKVEQFIRTITEQTRIE